MSLFQNLATTLAPVLLPSEPNGERKVMAVKVSLPTRKKAVQLQKIRDFSSASHVWGKDQKLLKCNLLLVPSNINYTVLLAMGRCNK